MCCPITVKTSVPLPPNGDLSGPIYAAKVWGTGVAATGFSDEEPNFGMGYTEASIAGNNTHVDLITFVYDVYEHTSGCYPLGNYLGRFPTSVSNVVFGHSVLGIEVVPVPQNISVGPSGGHPRVTWSPVPVDEEDLVGYHVYRKIGSGSWQRLTSSPQSGTSYSDGTIAISDKLRGTWIQYRVTSVIRNTGTLPDVESDPSVSKGIWGEPLWKEVAQALPDVFALQGNYPNPFNPVTNIKFDLPEESFVTLKVYNLMGHEIATLVTGSVEAGFQNVIWDGKNSHGNPVSSGMYLYRLDAISRKSDKEFHMTRKMVLLR